MIMFKKVGPVTEIITDTHAFLGWIKRNHLGWYVYQSACDVELSCHDLKDIQSHMDKLTSETPS